MSDFNTTAIRRRATTPVLESGSPASYAICKICRSGIFDQQPRVWLSKPAGLSHATCAEGRAA